MPTAPEECEFLEEEIKWVGQKMYQNRITPLQNKLEAITKIIIPKN